MDKTVIEIKLGTSSNASDILLMMAAWIQHKHFKKVSFSFLNKLNTVELHYSSYKLLILILLFYVIYPYF